MKTSRVESVPYSLCKNLEGHRQECPAVGVELYKILPTEPQLHPPRLFLFLRDPFDFAVDEISYGLVKAGCAESQFFITGNFPAGKNILSNAPIDGIVYSIGLCSTAEYHTKIIAAEAGKENIPIIGLNMNLMARYLGEQLNQWLSTAFQVTTS